MIKKLGAWITDFWIKNLSKFGVWITNFWNLDHEWMALGSRKVEPSSSLQNWTMFYAPRQAIHGGSTYNGFSYQNTGHGIGVSGFMKPASKKLSDSWVKKREPLPDLRLFLTSKKSAIPFHRTMIMMSRGGFFRVERVLDVDPPMSAGAGKTTPISLK